MSHSKRNTSLAFFTSHERALLRGTWGSQSARLSSASVLPFGHCTLCLLPAVDPVACSGFTAVISANDETSKAGEKRKRPICSKTHIFCRGCALENILAQKKEIKRLEKVEEAHRLDAEEQQFAQDQIRQEKELRTFEAAQSGLSGNGAVQVGDKGTKRKRLDNDEKDADKKGRSSFWIPSETPDAGLHLNSKIRKQEKKLAPICPGSAGEDVPHGFSLKVLTPVVFSEEARQKDSKEEGNTRLHQKVRARRHR
ncbi:hypothetical protein FH972_026138 [Carpinus fangiana]|uniref:Nitric oxide synthase-interacting protein zinc-finger domain-containing protein n=1 Tax=Carpinus fangiana TaxID=176857 RepID=A0A5N6L430_9ROSI|nr:hypothetical protein FH972_026138 [Carpinus fangiana]